MTEEVQIETSDGYVGVREEGRIVELTIQFPDAMCSIELSPDQAKRVANLLYHDAEAVDRTRPIPA